MISLGLDPSFTGFGWCVHNSSVAGPKRVVDKGTFKTTSKMVFVARNMTLRDQLTELIERYPEIQAVGVESPPFGESYSEGLFGLFVYVNEVLYTHFLDVVYFMPTELKRLTKMDPRVRRGSMDKQDMVEAAKVDTEIKRWNHNEADAYHVARHAARFWEYLNGEITQEDLVPSELWAFARIYHDPKGDLRTAKSKKGGLVFRENDRFYRFSALRVQD